MIYLQFTNEESETHRDEAACKGTQFMRSRAGMSNAKCSTLSNVAVPVTLKKKKKRKKMSLSLRVDD